jgi:hypothetical protein
VRANDHPGAIIDPAGTGDVRFLDMRGVVGGRAPN